MTSTHVAHIGSKHNDDGKRILLPSAAILAHDPDRTARQAVVSSIKNHIDDINVLLNKNNKNNANVIKIV